jgi:hypothetical protein
MAALGNGLILELTELATKHARKQRFQFGSALAIKLVEDLSLPIGQIAVSSHSEDIVVEWIPALDIAGKRYMLNKARTVIGRDASSDIKVDDSGLSRNHFEVVWDGKAGGVRDLKSTNGTRVDGRVITQTGILADSVISAGHTEFVFRVVAKTVTDE